jgi:Transglycosylase SLT domain
MALEWLDNLNDTQAQNAKEIIKQAKSIGVDPVLAVTLAFHESGLMHQKDGDKPILGDAGEVGLMQVKPKTAEMMGYKPEDLNDPKKNAEIGLKYLKQGIDKYQDPVYAVAGYNAGMDHPYFSDSSKPLPKSTMDYLTAIKTLGGFNLPEKEEITPASDEDFYKKKAEALVQYSPDLRKDVQAGLLGATLGGIGGGLYSAGSKAAQVAQAITNNLSGQSSGSPRAVTNWANAMGVGDRGAQTYEEAYRLNTGKRKGATINNRTPTFRFPKGPVVEPPSSLTTTMQSPAVQGALTGLVGGALGQESVSRYQNRDYPGMVAAGLGAAGQIINKLPLPYAKQIGTGMSMASPAALALIDKIRENQQNQDVSYDLPSSNDEMNTATKPAFGLYPRALP